MHLYLTVLQFFQNLARGSGLNIPRSRTCSLWLNMPVVNELTHSHVVAGSLLSYSVDYFIILFWLIWKWQGKRIWFDNLMVLYNRHKWCLDDRSVFPLTVIHLMHIILNKAPVSSIFNFYSNLINKMVFILTLYITMIVCLSACWADASGSVCVLGSVLDRCVICLSLI